jgi:hypothetical protein
MVLEMLRLFAAQCISIDARFICLEAREINNSSFIAGINRRTRDDFRNWTEEAAKV